MKTCMEVLFGVIGAFAVVDYFYPGLPEAAWMFVFYHIVIGG